MTKAKIIIGNKEKHFLEIEISKSDVLNVLLDGRVIFKSEINSNSPKYIKFKVGRSEQHFIEIKLYYNEIPNVELKVDGIKENVKFSYGEKYVNKKT